MTGVSDAATDQTVASAAEGTSEPVGGQGSTAVQTQSDPLPSERTVQEPAPGQSDVARLEDVLTPKSADDDRASAPEVLKPMSPEKVEILTRAHELLVDLTQAPREVARFEDVLTVRPEVDVPPIRPRAVAALPEVEVVPPPFEVAPSPPAEPTPEVTPAPVEKAPAWTDKRVTSRSYVPAYALRAAFWFEQASAFLATDDGEEAVEAAPEVAPAPRPVESVAPPILEPATAPPAPDEGSPSFRAIWLARTARNHWMGALCVLALVGMVALLTGRDFRRLAGGRRATAK